MGSGLPLQSNDDLVGVVAYLVLEMPDRACSRRVVKRSLRPNAAQNGKNRLEGARNLIQQDLAKRR
jgi:hypothetical protein